MFSFHHPGGMHEEAILNLTDNIVVLYCETTSKLSFIQNHLLRSAMQENKVIQEIINILQKSGYRLKILDVNTLPHITKPPDAKELFSPAKQNIKNDKEFVNIELPKEFVKRALERFKENEKNEENLFKSGNLSTENKPNINDNVIGWLKTYEDDKEESTKDLLIKLRKLNRFDPDDLNYSGSTLVESAPNTVNRTILTSDDQTLNFLSQDELLSLIVLEIFSLIDKYDRDPSGKPMMELYQTFLKETDEYSNNFISRDVFIY
jgi:hypothetical protein